MNIALITAKGNNKSIEEKNLIKIFGKTLMSYSIDAAKRSKNIDRIFVSTEDKKIEEEAKKNRVEVIKRPAQLSTPDSNHGDAIFHAVSEITKIINADLENSTFTILLGNTVMVGSYIDKCIDVLIMNKEAGSCMTVWKAQDDHPYRAMTVDNRTGYLRSFSNVSNVSTNRQSYPDVYYYDQGPWVVRYNTVIESAKKRFKGIGTGPGPWWWMGNNCIPVVRNWVAGRDIHSQIDINIAKCYLRNSI